MINLVCHDLNLSDDGNYQKTMSWIKICLCHAQNSEIRILLTKIDEAKEARRIKRETFIKQFVGLIEKEITLTEQHSRECSDDSTQKLYEEQLRKYKELKEQIQPTNGSPSKLLELSCVKGYEDSVKDLTNFLLEFTENPNNKEIMLRHIDKELFVKIGKLGIRQRMIENSQQTSHDKPEEGNMTGDVKQVRPDLKSQTVAKHKENTPLMTQQFLTDQITENLQLLSQESCRNPKKGEPIGFDPKGGRQQKFLRFVEVVAAFHEVYEQCNKKKISGEQLQNETEKSLTKLKERGLLKYFIKGRNLEDDDVIFHDLSTLVSILSCVLRHDLHKFLIYNHEDTLCTHIYKEGGSEFEQHTQSLKNHGILTQKLLKFLLQQNKCIIPVESVSQMLVSVNIGIILMRKGGIKDLFIPFMVEHDPLPQMDNTLKNMKRCNKTALSLETTLKYDIPLSFFNELLLKICEKEQRLLEYENFIKIWGKGISVDMDAHQGKLMMCHNEDKSVTIILQANITEVAGHKLLFENVAFIYKKAWEIRKFKYPGLPLDYVLIFQHSAIDAQACHQVKSHGVKKILNPENHLKETFNCGCKKIIPCGFISPLSEGKYGVTVFTWYLFIFRNVINYVLSTLTMNLTLTDC